MVKQKTQKGVLPYITNNHHIKKPSHTFRYRHIFSTPFRHILPTFFRRTFSSPSTGIFAFFITTAIISICMPGQSTSATEGDVPTAPVATPLTTINNEPSVSVSASTVDFGKIVKSYGENVVRTASNTVTVNAPLYGYELYISTSDSSNNLVRYGTAGTSSTEIIPAIPTISMTNPTTLGSDSWGFAVKKRNAAINSGSEDVPTTANFDTSYPTGDDSNPDSKFSAVPTQDNQLLIAERNSTAENVPTDVYYGVSIKDVPIGIYQGTVTYTAIGKEPTTHTVKIKLIPGISKVTIGDIECNASTATASTDASDPAGTKQCEVTLTYGYSYSLTATPEEGYKFKEWTLNNTNGSFSDSNMATTAFTAGQGSTTITPTTIPRQTITLNQNGATTNGSETTIATHGESTLATITNPQKSYTISGFDINYNNASGASISSTATLTSTHTFTGWYKEAIATNKIASNSATPVLEANTDYTDTNGKWISTSDQTLYAGWTGQTITLPTITKEDHTCGWTDSTNTTVVTYASGASFTPTSSMVLHGVCKANLRITLNQNGATTNGTTSIQAMYGSSSLPSITNPSRTHTVTGFDTNYNNASGAIVGSDRNNICDTKYSHTDNIDDSGIANGTYTNGLRTNNTITIPCASEIEIDIYYSTEKNYDYLYLFQGEYSGNVSGNMTAGQLYTYNGGNKTTYDTATHTTITIPGNTVTFSFYSDSSQVYYGYYAIIKGYSPVTSITHNYTFDGWYNSASGGTKIITSNGALTPSNGWTDESSRWINDYNQTVYAHWTGTITLPTITKTGYTCGWTTSTNANTITYNSGASIALPSNITLHGICIPGTHNLTINFEGSGVSLVQVRTASGAGGTLIGTISSSGGSISGLTYGTTYYLYPAFFGGYELYGWKNTSSIGTLSDSTSSNPAFTIDGDGTLTIIAVSTNLPYMQDYAKSTCEAEASSNDVYLRDRRDNKVYTVRYINGNCWMTSNLRTTGIISATYSNFTGNNVDLSEIGDLTTGDMYDSYGGPKTHVGVDSNGFPTVWYNYAAASAKTIIYSNNNTDAIHDICPKNWRMPTMPEQTSITSYKDAYNPVAGGYYKNNVLYNPELAYWWSTSAEGSNYSRRSLGYERDRLATIYSLDRYFGSYMRCIRSTSYSITFNGDSKVNNFTVDGETISKGSTKTLQAGLTYTITVNYVGEYYGSDTPLQINSGVGTVDGVKFTVGEGTATVYANSAQIPFIQDFTKANCQAQASSGNINLVDRRDDKVYTARYINGNCWMTSNLRITGTVASTYSNFTGNSIDLSIDLTNGDSNDEPRIHEGNLYGKTVYYNYVAASAKTILGKSNEATATQDICPKNWRLPTRTEQSSILNYRDEYGPVMGGYYYQGSIGGSGLGHWWASTADSASFRHRLYYNYFNDEEFNVGQISISASIFIRCIRST